jgi:hypothetical protein
MTYQEDCILPAELMERVSEQGFDIYLHPTTALDGIATYQVSHIVVEQARLAISLFLLGFIQNTLFQFSTTNRVDLAAIRQKQHSTASVVRCRSTDGNKGA